nr:hypothetical protein MarFTME_047 [Marseillevirus futianmevirus]
MEDFLAPRDLVAFSIASDEPVSPDKFKRAVSSDKAEWVNWTIKKKEVLPDGTLHGFFERHARKGSWTIKTTRNYRLGRLHEKLFSTGDDNNIKRTYFGEFVDGLAHGKFTFICETILTGEEKTTVVVYDKGKPISIEQKGETFEIVWGKNTVKIREGEFTDLYFSETFFPTSVGIVPLGHGHTWSVLSLDKHGKLLYGKNRLGIVCRIFLPIFCDKIF